MRKAFLLGMLLTLSVFSLLLNVENKNQLIFKQPIKRAYQFEQQFL